MAQGKCCFGCSNVRNGSWAISIIDMIICIILMVATVMKITPEYTIYSENYFERYYCSQELDLFFFLKSFVLFLFFYINMNLKKSTYIHIAQSINHWLLVNTIFVIFFIIFIGFCTLKYGLPYIIVYGAPVTIFLLYQIHVVKRFYADELDFLVASEQNGTQPTMNATHYIPVTNPTVPSANYPIQTGPYIIQEVPQPIVQAPLYPQQPLHYQQQQQQQQQPSYFSSRDSNIPQEYTNPPPYSPSYMPQDISITK